MVVSSNSRRLNSQNRNNLPTTPNRVSKPRMSKPLSGIQVPRSSRARSTSPSRGSSIGPRPSSEKPFKARDSKTTLRAMPSQMPVPGWLRLLKKTEKASLVLALGLVTSAVATYGWAVYSQHQWGKSFNHLNTLRRDERQFLKSTELMKNDIARHNDPKQYGLVPRNSDHIVVIPPAPLRPALPTRNTGPDPKAKPITPIGY
jgi:hypothetical protein